MQANDIMTTDVTSVDPDTSVEEVARILLRRNVSAVPVVDESGRLKGIVSEGDLLRRSESGTERSPSWWLRIITMPETKVREFVKTHGRYARDVMTSNVVAVTEDTPVFDIAATLETHRIKRVPVLRDGRVVGIVSRANLLQALAAHVTPAEVRETDREIRSTLTETIRRDLPGASLQVDYTVTDGIVRLWGTAMSSGEKDAIRVAAESIPGVSRVDDNITVFPQSVRTALGV